MNAKFIEIKTKSVTDSFMYYSVGIPCPVPDKVVNKAVGLYFNVKGLRVRIDGVEGGRIVRVISSDYNTKNESASVRKVNFAVAGIEQCICEQC